jgi:transcriptional regulator with XRE-family HTH domain
MAAVSLPAMIESSTRWTGRDLLILRVAANVRQTAIARAWGCSRGNVARIESSRRPTARAVERYLAALRTAEAEG